MVRKAKTFKIITGCFLWMAITGIWLALGCLTADAGTKIRPITPMGEMGGHRVNVSAEDYFDVVGILNLIESDRIIVGDRQLTIAPGMSFSRARQWNLVGVKLNRAGEVVAFEIISDEPN